MTLLAKFLVAIAREEGFFVSGTRPARNNNPGDLEYGEFAQLHGATGTDGRFAIFPSSDMGFAAMKALFQTPAYRGKTVEEALNKFAPPTENDVSSYLANVCAWVPCLPADVIDELL